MTEVRAASTLEQAEFAFLFAAQELLDPRDTWNGSATIITRSEGGYGVFNFLCGVFHSAKVESDFDSFGGGFYQRYLERADDGTFLHTTVEHISFVNRDNGVVTNSLADIDELERFIGRLKNPSVHDVVRFNPEPVPRPKQPRKISSAAAKLLGTIPIKRRV